MGKTIGISFEDGEGGALERALAILANEIQFEPIFEIIIEKKNIYCTIQRKATAKRAEIHESLCFL